MFSIVSLVNSMSTGLHTSDKSKATILYSICIFAFAVIYYLGSISTLSIPLWAFMFVLQTIKLDDQQYLGEAICTLSQVSSLYLLNFSIAS